MAREEKKYLVEDLSSFRDRLIDLSAEHVGAGSSQHFYADKPGNDVVKLVISKSKCEIHKLQHIEGRFKLVESIPLPSKAAGFAWLRASGFNQVSVIRMYHDDYKFKDGIVGLYKINDRLQSVILEYEPGGHSEVERLMGLQRAKIIDVPYNKLLEREGWLKPKNI